MIALAGTRRRLHLAEQAVHLGGVEAAAGTDAAVAGHGAANLVQAFPQDRGLVDLGQFIGEDMRLVKVSVKSMSAVPGTLEFYMGKNTPERREYIMENLV